MAFPKISNLGCYVFCRVPKELRFPYLASLQYVGPLHDDFVFRCTAIILSSKQLLTTSICVGSKERENPNSVVLGVSDMRGHIDEKLTFQLKTNAMQINNDVVLFDLHTDINFKDQSMKNVSMATLCYENELTEQSRLYAVGFAQNEATNCGLFKLRLERLSDCRVPELSRPVTGINTNATHICVRAMPETSPRLDGCKNCLTATSSVLHVERSDGSLCVAGIATPTTDECTVNSESTLYTIFVKIGFKNACGQFVLPDGPTYRNNND
ncbi:uncharacterized protein LOC115482955 isoform X2 [Drosophila hydei]|uniref:Uncharacterized protein LOC115482955 isoform X2 n=1 Tax=Drosophila hydei TaxID=7224 RepID=A0A6J2SNL6_DROHY|nr:uncharacterized protein LOC115482955 isoform X2 [Drosophila hydei]